MKTNLILISIMFILVMSGCADANNVTECVSGHTYGFFGGLWHGMIAPFAFIGSLIDSSIHVWAHNNTGGWYSFGFLLGVGAFSSSTRTVIKYKK